MYVHPCIKINRKTYNQNYIGLSRGALHRTKSPYITSKTRRQDKMMSYYTVYVKCQTSLFFNNDNYFLLFFHMSYQYTILYIHIYTYQVDTFTSFDYHIYKVWAFLKFLKKRESLPHFLVILNSKRGLCTFTKRKLLV